jgi:hypothetical protein
VVSREHTNLQTAEGATMKFSQLTGNCPAVPTPVRIRWARFREVQLVRLCAAPLVLPYHWIDGHSALCTGHSCAGCECGNQAIRRGYAPALVCSCDSTGFPRGAWARAVWELTADQLDYWPGLPDWDRVAVVERLRRSNGPVQTREPGAVLRAIPACPPWDILPSLVRVFGPVAAQVMERAHS